MRTVFTKKQTQPEIVKKWESMSPLQVKIEIYLRAMHFIRSVCQVEKTPEKAIAALHKYQTKKAIYIEDFAILSEEIHAVFKVGLANYKTPPDFGGEVEKIMDTPLSQLARFTTFASMICAASSSAKCARRDVRELSKRMRVDAVDDQDIEAECAWHLENPEYMQAIRDEGDRRERAEKNK